MCRPCPPFVWASFTPRSLEQIHTYALSRVCTRKRKRSEGRESEEGQEGSPGEVRRTEASVKGRGSQVVMEGSDLPREGRASVRALSPDCAWGTLATVTGAVGAAQPPGEAGPWHVRLTLLTIPGLRGWQEASGRCFWLPRCASGLHSSLCPGGGGYRWTTSCLLAHPLVDTLAG